MKLKAQAVPADSIPTSNMTFTWPHTDTHEAICCTENQPKQPKKLNFHLDPFPHVTQQAASQALTVENVARARRNAVSSHIHVDQLKANVRLEP